MAMHNEAQAAAPLGATDVGLAHFDTLLICGIGLIGGSFARALRTAHRAGHVTGAGRIVGIDRDAAALARARQLGVIDEGVVFDGAALDEASAAGPKTGAQTGADVAEVDAAMALHTQVAQADVIVLCTPVAVSVALLRRVAPALRADAVLTDVGSTKQDICAAAAAELGLLAARFVAGHPIAGAASSGIDASAADLFAQRDVILCPTPGLENAGPTARVAALWRAVGARVRTMPALAHDAVFASVSHLPHLLAFAYIAHILETADPAQRLAMAGTGFRDFSRIAASSPDMWRDICMANRASILEELDAYAAVLAQLRAAVDVGDTTALRDLFERSRAARSAWTMGGEGATATVAAGQSLPAQPAQ